MFVCVLVVSGLFFRLYLGGFFCMLLVSWWFSKGSWLCLDLNYVLVVFGKCLHCLLGISWWCLDGSRLCFGCHLMGWLCSCGVILVVSWFCLEGILVVSR